MSNKQKAINGGKWVTTSTVISTVFQFGQIALLARLLPPTAFGLVSISSLIINFFSMFSNLGFNNSIIYKQEEDKNVLSSLYFLNLFLGFIIFGIVYLTSPLAINFFNEPKLNGIVKAASLFFLIVYFGQIYSILMQKELRFKTLAVIDIISVVIGTIITVVLAYRGFGAYSLIYGQIIIQGMKTSMYILYGRDLFKVKMHFRFAEVKDHLRFGVYNLGDGIVGFIQSNSDNLLIGSMLGVKLLGYYSLASQLAVFPITRLNPIILQVAYPIVAKMKDNDSEIKRAYIKILDFISYCNIPLLAGLFITADIIVPLIYGAGWEPTIGLVRIMTIASIFMCLTHPLFTLAFSKGKPNLLFYLNVLTLIVKVPLIYFLGKYALATGVAWALALATFINLIANFAIVQKLIGNFFFEFLKNISKPILFSIVMILAIIAYKHFIGNQGPIHALLQVSIGAAVFIGFTLAYKIPFSEVKNFKNSL
ncbi:MAG: colanic acid exporter [Pedobacter sp.]|nr:MAG: colanic acid exporter [Pedobacter sp.]